MQKLTERPRLRCWGSRGRWRREARPMVSRAMKLQMAKEILEEVVVMIQRRKEEGTGWKSTY